MHPRANGLTTGRPVKASNPARRCSPGVVSNLWGTTQHRPNRGGTHLQHSDALDACNTAEQQFAVGQPPPGFYRRSRAKGRRLG